MLNAIKFPVLTLSQIFIRHVSLKFAHLLSSSRIFRMEVRTTVIFHTWLIILTTLTLHLHIFASHVKNFIMAEFK